MKTNTLLIAALAGIAAAQDFDFDAVQNAPDPSLMGPPLTAVSATTSSINTAVLAASISSDITTVATASITGTSASAASTEQPSSQPAGSSLAKRGQSTTTTPTTQQTSTGTSSSTTACATTPEAGTYCGFINPNDPCAPQPDGYGPHVTPDTPAAFEAYPDFHKDALTAITPPKYQEVFRDLNASTSANSYITFYTLESYNVTECAAHCDNTNLCTAFNIYIERDPSLNPNTNATNSAYNCPNPPSITNFKCSLWGSSIDASSATNQGGYRDQFQVVIAGSNGYDKTNTTTPPSVPGCTPPTSCPGGAISAGGGYHMGSNFYPGPFNPSLCQLYATAQTAKNKAAAQQQGKSSYVPCNMFNAYMVHINGVAQGTYCALFDTILTPDWASFTGSWNGGSYFSIDSSWTYSLAQQDSGRL